ncbi:MAG: alpha/beta hydrolase [Ferruginibacter sp.]
MSKYDSRLVNFHEYGKGTSIIILSGGPGNDCHQEEEVALEIAKKYHAILIEQRGTGISMPTSLSSENITLEFAKKDILFLIDSLRLGKVIIYGHSWGALLATAFALDYPEKVTSLIFVGPGPMSMDSKYWNQIRKNRVTKLSEVQVKRYMELSFKSNLKTIAENESKELLAIKNFMNVYDTSNKDEVYAKINRGVANAETYDLMIRDLTRINFNLTEKISTLKMPVTIITGKEDPLAFLTTAFQESAPNTKVYWIEKSGHFPMYENSKDFYPKLFEALVLK